MSRQPFRVGVGYWPADVGPYMWHEYSATRTAADLTAMAELGISDIRVHLTWDAFMPSSRQVSPYRIRDFEDLLNTASGLGIGVTPSLFAQSLGGCIFLPAYAVVPGTTSRAVRILCDGEAVKGTPRDLYTDTLMYELSLTWLETMLTAFSGHPAIRRWNLGYDPAATMRPLRIEHAARWVSALASRVHAAGEECSLMFASDDITVARGVRLAEVGKDIDEPGLIIRTAAAPPPLADAGDGPAFLLALALRMLPAPDAIGADITASTGPKQAEGVLAQLLDAGVRTAWWSWFSDVGPRVAALPPFDRHPEMGIAGLRDTSGNWKQLAAVIKRFNDEELETQTPRPWPDALDVEAYYKELPASLLDLYAAWHGGRLSK